MSPRYFPAFSGRTALTLLALLALTLLAHVTPFQPTALAAVPASFEDTRVTGVSSPTDLAFTPDGRMLITSQIGRLYVYQSGALLATPALDLTGVICNNAERGLLGIAVDPNFAANNYIYLYYTFNKFGNDCPRVIDLSVTPVNRVARFTLPNSNSIAMGSQLVLVDNIASLSGNHNAGSLALGADGLLYISVGDSGPANNAVSLAVLNGKMLRVGLDGSIPASNPYASAAGSRRCGDPAGVPAGSGPCQEIAAYGLRNPFRFAFRPGSNQFYINDVGQTTWEEIDEGSLGAHYGWNTREGPCVTNSTSNCGAPPASMTNPIFAYNHSSGNLLPGSGCSAITGGAFVPSGIWPAPYDGAYLFADLGCGTIFLLQPNGAGGFSGVPFVTSLGNSSVVTLKFGPHNGTQALYYTTYGGAYPNQVRRVAFTGTLNRAPVAVVGATPASGAAPLPVVFSAEGSSDPDGDPLTFDWSFGDGTLISGTQALTVEHSFVANGVYTATLTARDDQGAASQPASIRIDVGNAPPLPVISSPTPQLRFSVGQSITLQGSASDPDQGVLPDSALRWELLLHHVDQGNPGNAHVHPFLAPTSGNNLVIIGPAPEDLGATALSYLEIRLTATDQSGLSTTITRTLEPERITLTFESQPAGLLLEVNAQQLATPQQVVSWPGYDLSVSAADQLDGTGRRWFFAGWSDAGAGSHSITTPAANTSYTATFEPARLFWLPLV